MSDYLEILDDLKSDLGLKKILTAKELAPYISKSPQAQASLRFRNKFPIPTLKMGGMIYVTVYDLAKYLAREINPPPLLSGTPTSQDQNNLLIKRRRCIPIGR